MTSLFLPLLIILLTQVQSTRQTPQTNDEETALYTIIAPDISNDDVYSKPTTAHTQSPINSYRLPPSPLLKHYPKSHSDTAPPSSSSPSSPSSTPSFSNTSYSTSSPTSQSTTQPSTPRDLQPTTRSDTQPTNPPSLQPSIRSSTQPSTPPTIQPTIQPNRYTLTQYNSSNFFDHFEFETISDPTHGVVDYVDYNTAEKLGIAKYSNAKIFLGVDDVTVLKAWDRGRKSLRLSSKRILNGNNIIVLDLDHMPSTVGNVLPKGCSLWPAFWTVGPHWPYAGEIDIIEYVNIDSSGTTGLHTSNYCDMKMVSVDSFSGAWKRSWSGVIDNNCYNKAPGQDANSGCVVWGPVNSVGAAFNNVTYSDDTEDTDGIEGVEDIEDMGGIKGWEGGRGGGGEGEREGKGRGGGERERGGRRRGRENVEEGNQGNEDGENKGEKGGVYVMQWDANKEIRTFYFPRNNIPPDITKKDPKPDTWGLPYSRFDISPSSCCSSDHFKDHKIVFDTTFCGDWAGSVFQYTCDPKMSCASFVRDHPAEFTEAYWLINYLDIYDYSD